MKNTFGRVADRVGGGHKVFTKLTEVRLNSRLIEVKNWQDLAEAANYSAAALSQRCQISTRQLERLFVGGEFTTAGGLTNANCIASWDGKEWSTINNGVSDGT